MRLAKCYALLLSYQVVFAGIIGIIKWFAITGVNEQILGALGKAVASVEAELAEEWHLLQVDDHVLHQFELADHLLLLLGEFGATDG